MRIRNLLNSPIEDATSTREPEKSVFETVLDDLAQADKQDAKQVQPAQEKSVFEMVLDDLAEAETTSNQADAINTQEKSVFEKVLNDFAQAEKQDAAHVKTTSNIVTNNIYSGNATLTPSASSRKRERIFFNTIFEKDTHGNITEVKFDDNYPGIRYGNNRKRFRN